MKIKVTLNGKKKTLTGDPMLPLAKVLQKNHLLSIRTDCDGTGYCGACSVILNGVKVNSCQVRLGQLDDNDEIFTTEGFAKGNELHPIQKAFLEAGVVQCGHCTPGMMLAVKELYDNIEDPTEDDMKDYLSGNMCRCTGYKQYLNVLNILKKESFDDHKTFRDDLRAVGKPAKKVDGPKLVKADPAYVGDMVTSDALIIKVKKSPYAHAFIKSIDTSKAEELEGVEYIATYKDVPDRPYNTAGQGFPEPSPYDFRLLDRTLRYLGDRVAIVAATTAEIAEKAVNLIKVEYEILPAIFDPFESKKSEVLIQDRDISVDPLPIGQDPKTNRAAHNDGGIGDVKKGFEEADVIVERDYGTTRVHCTPMETHRCFGYMEGGRLVLRASTQVPWHLRRILSNLLSVKENKIHVIKERVGGAYGAKQDLVQEDIVAWVVWQTGMPAYYEMTREEEFLNARVRHTMFFRIKAGATKDGKLTAIDLREISDTGPYGNHCLTVPMNACSKSLPLLKCENMHYDVSTYYTNNIISGAYQGYGAPQGSFAVQMALAELAEKLGIDQLEFLRQNMVKKGDFLEILKSLGEGQEGIAQRISSCGLKECLDRGAELIGWDKPIVPSDNPYIKKGRGVAIIQQGSGLPGIDSANAEIKMMNDGTFMILMGGTDLGTGLDTLAVKVASEMLCTDIENFSILSSDTDVTPFDVGAYASSGTYFSGMAAYKAAEDMKRRLLEISAQFLETEVDNLVMEYPGIIRKKDNKEASLTYAQIAYKTQSGNGVGQIISRGHFTTEEAPIPYGAHFAEVSVDTRTGEVTVDKYYGIQECGTPINPELALGQVYGGVVKSIGHSVMEVMTFDPKTGKCHNPNFADYKVPMFRDLPKDFKCELIGVDEHLGPYGGKSVSEISTNGAAAVIGIAIYKAVGVWMQEWPFTAERVYQALQDKKDKPYLYDFD